ncbi:helix-turn-helix domain-containing protein [Defluviimonas salinarum]|nr:helix-turn-helix domain-containing protein [Defluviimonas salinarum]
MEEIDRVTPAQIRAARALLGMTQKELCARARIAIGSLAKMEDGPLTRLNPNIVRGLVATLGACGIRFTATGVELAPAIFSSSRATGADVALPAGAR